jgi:hypothetical protein
MSLETGKRVPAYHWEELPIPQHVIDRVNELVEREKQPVMNNGYPIFEWSLGVPMNNNKGHCRRVHSPQYVV